MVVPERVRQIDTDVIRLWSPDGRHWDVPFGGYTVQRDKMDQGIADQAVAEGAELRTETTVHRVTGKEVATNHGTVAGKVIIGSDGPRSTVAQSMGLDWPVAGPAMSCTIDGDFDSVTDLFFGNLAPGGYAWIIPKGTCANVGLGTWQHFRGRLDSLFHKFLDQRGLPHPHGTGGYVPVEGPVGRTVKENVLLVGGAAGAGMAPEGGGGTLPLVSRRVRGGAAAD